jgi:hypothetical protein
VRKIIILGVKKAAKSLKSPKTEFGAQNQYGRVTYPSIGSFTWSKKKYTFEIQKGENKTSELKHGKKAQISSIVKYSSNNLLFSST